MNHEYQWEWQEGVRTDQYHNSYYHPTTTALHKESVLWLMFICGNKKSGNRKLLSNRERESPPTIGTWKRLKRPGEDRRQEKETFGMSSFSERSPETSHRWWGNGNPIPCAIVFWIFTGDDEVNSSLYILHCSAEMSGETTHTRIDFSFIHHTYRNHGESVFYTFCIFVSLTFFQVFSACLFISLEFVSIVSRGLIVCAVFCVSGLSSSME